MGTGKRSATPGDRFFWGIWIVVAGLAVAGAWLGASSEATPSREARVELEVASLAAAGRAPDTASTLQRSRREGDRELAAALTGLWTRWDSRAEGAKIRFWYFHGDGRGLYRYGRVGLTNTHSFDYHVIDGRLSLRFRKSGAEHLVGLRLDEDEAGRARLRLDPDPEEAGARYLRVEVPLSSPVGGRLWMDFRRHATGGSEFAMYQFNAPAIDGRGIGWFHAGDFDDWSTESLTYRIDGERIELYFDLREELAATTFERREEGDQRVLELRDDPRDFYKDHRYIDAGASFGTLPGAPALDASLFGDTPSRPRAAAPASPLFFALPASRSR